MNEANYDEKQKQTNSMQTKPIEGILDFRRRPHSGSGVRNVFLIQSFSPISCWCSFFSEVQQLKGWWSQLVDK